MQKKPYSKQNPPPMWADRAIRMKYESGWSHVVDGWYIQMPSEQFQKQLRYWSYHLTHECEKGTFRACSAMQSHKGKKKFGIYAYCSACKVKLPERIKSLIRFAIQ